MPILTVNTNVPTDKVPADFGASATDVVAKTLGKPVAYVCTHINPGQMLYFGGSSSPAANCELSSIGALSTESNKKHSKNIMEFLEKTLGIPSSRIYITFKNVNKADIGFQGTTFDDLM